MDVGLCDSAVAGAPVWLPLLLRRLKLCDGAALAPTDRSPAQRRRVSGHNVAFLQLTKSSAQCLEESLWTVLWSWSDRC
jgi:hypothetical protein